MSIITASKFKHVVDYGEPWANQLIELINLSEANVQTAWHDLISLFAASSATKPSKKWHSSSDQLIDTIGRKPYRGALIQCFKSAALARTHPLPPAEFYAQFYEHPDEPHEENWTLLQYEESVYGGQDIRWVYTNRNALVLKSFMWSAVKFSDDEVASVLRTLVAAFCKKISGRGMRQQKLASAGAYALASMSGDVGVKELIVLRAATRYPVAFKVLDKHLEQAAKDRGMGVDELSALAVPDYGLSKVGELRETMGEVVAVANILDSGKVDVAWLSDGITKKTPPASVKSEFKDEIKEFKAATKDLEVAIAAHTQRLESLYLQNQDLTLDKWLGQYADHPLIGVLARRLIWQFDFSGQSQSAIYTAGGYVGYDNNAIAVHKAERVSLWHPITSTPEEVLEWRSWVIAHGINQPFKQAHREVYVLTDAERKLHDHSQRFSNHILKHAQFHALASQRLWSQKRGGGWDAGDENSATKCIKSLDLQVEFEAGGAQAYGLSDSMMFACVGTGKLVFSRDGQPLEIDSLPPVVNSEIMRDVDLFVSVCSIGNDPEWEDRDNEYWRAVSFGDLNHAARVRKDVLQSILPSFKASQKMKLENNYLVIDGKLNQYGIHLGSANVQILPDKRFLSIVSGSSKSEVMLPFNGDSILSTIISKALLLVNDTKIKDQAIVSQLENDR